MIYLDSTYIVKCYVNEPGTKEVLQLVQGHPGRASCGHGRLEFWSGLHRQVREGHFEPGGCGAGLPAVSAG